MKKHTILCSLLAACVSTGALAGNFYLGPTLILGKVSASNSSFTGVYPRLSAGYAEHLPNGYYVAGEIFGIPTNIKMSSSTNNNGVNAKIANSIGASFLPGIMLNDTVLGYLRMGVINSNFNASSRKTGGQLGVGLQTALTPQWSLRGEYIYTAYRSVSNLGSPKNNELGIGAIYHFDV